MALWEQILVGALAVVLVIWLGPGIKAALAQSREAKDKDWRGVLLPLVFVVLFVLLLISWVRQPAAAATYPLPPPGSDVVGDARIVTVQEGDTLIDIARQNDLGYNEIVAANPGIDPWVPAVGAEIVLPTIHVLPSAPREGIIINLTEMRLYYYPPPPPGGEATVMTFPIGIGQEGSATPLGITRIVEKTENPAWTVPDSIRAEYEQEGNPLPHIVPPGPDNPLGAYAMRLGWGSFLIHGTNKPYGVGMRVSHGCIRLYPEDIKALFERVPMSTPVWVIDQPFKLGRDRGLLVLEVHTPVTEPDRPPVDFSGVILAAVEAATPADQAEQSRRAVREVIRRKLGVPEPVGYLKPETAPAAAAAAAAAPAASAAASAAPAASGWMLQLGAFSSRRNASRVAKELADLGASVVVRTHVDDGYCRVLVGPYPDRNAAHAAKERFERVTGYRGEIMPADRPGLSECLL
jgi:L,D-transpeptidase ErfK/SrfK